MSDSNPRGRSPALPVFKAKASEHSKCGPDLRERKIAKLQQLARLHIFCTIPENMPVNVAQRELGSVLVTTPDLAIIVDGAGVPMGGCHHGVAWYAQQLGAQTLSALSGRPGIPLTKVSMKPWQP
ncbi:hypothetical protein E0H75_03180 [Kribbella capetownensis]|uniref:Uncharacterized protein n=1 Tax=Kribbella capetownensis TaxID=1572659 RepID=A0A4R0K169_9ACTN|nr:hypothetical protein [Kribbella capetownensis]TCC52767.1 hypothetical protein E0H75_03180 [Kribbella capetownensis]